MAGTIWSQEYHTGTSSLPEHQDRSSGQGEFILGPGGLQLWLN